MWLCPTRASELESQHALGQQLLRLNHAGSHDKEILQSFSLERAIFFRYLVRLQGKRLCGYGLQMHENTDLRSMRLECLVSVACLKGDRPVHGRGEIPDVTRKIVLILGDGILIAVFFCNGFFNVRSSSSIAGMPTLDE
jgi:hypothetical protein